MWLLALFQILSTGCMSWSQDFLGCTITRKVEEHWPTPLKYSFFQTELFNTKKGWLQRQTNEGNWTKHWFVLAKNQLHFYPDSSSEDVSIIKKSTIFQLLLCTLKDDVPFQFTKAIGLSLNATFMIEGNILI